MNMSTHFYWIFVRSKYESRLKYSWKLKARLGWEQKLIEICNYWKLEIASLFVFSFWHFLNWSHCSIKLHNFQSNAVEHVLCTLSAVSQSKIKAKINYADNWDAHAS